MRRNLQGKMQNQVLKKYTVFVTLRGEKIPVE